MRGFFSTFGFRYEYGIRLSHCRLRTLRSYRCLESPSDRQEVTRHRQASAHWRQHLLRHRRRHTRPQVRRTHLPHLRPPRVGLRQLARRVQPLHQLSRGGLARTALQPAVQHEHLPPDVGRQHARRSPQPHRGAACRGHVTAGRTRARQPRRAGTHARGTRHLRTPHQGLHREAVGPSLHPAAAVHHQAPPRAPHLRQQLLQRPLSGHTPRRLQRAHCAAT